jgi:RNA polymerase sigma factor (sigma-70 family)
LPPRARNVVDTSDLVQETFLNAIKRLGSFQPRHAGAFSAYLRKAILNRIRQEVRKSASEPVITTLDGSEVDPSPSPLEETIEREVTDRYEQAFMRLKEDDRAAIFLRIDLELSHEDVADALGKPSADAARKAVNRALVRLAEEMCIDGRC